MVGVMFMALTLTITSFTCTFPVVGGLIVMAAGGQFFYPIIGLATFSAVLALPFFLLALAPGLISKMPRSGDWMNAVNVSFSRRWDSAASVANTNDDLPDPDTPVNTVSFFFGMSSDTSARLFSRAPRTSMTSWLSAARRPSVELTMASIVSLKSL